MENTAHSTAIKPTQRSWASKTTTVDMGQRCGKFYVTVDKDGGRVVRIHISAGKLKSGTCAMTHLFVLEQLINHKLEHGSTGQKIAEFLSDIVCEQDRAIFNGPKSCHDAIGRVLAKG